jgi:molybdenum cofactor cytidylyltransferase
LNHKHHITHLLLAAGASTRMGHPKQLLPWLGQSLIRHAIQQIREAGITEKIIVVLGANQEAIAEEIKDLKIIIADNPDWASGMGSSVRSGVERALQDTPDHCDGIFVSLVDQPLVQARHYREIFQIWQTNQQAVVAAQYDEIAGVPALFGRAFFPQLLALKGQAGARKILAQASEVISISMPEARFDLDTPEDYEKMINDQ